MSKKLCHGGPAFPFNFHNQTSRYQESFHPSGAPVAPDGAEQYGGMTLRDYFAAKAISVAWDAYNEGYSTMDQEDIDSDTLAQHAYQIADAMLKARAA